MWIWLWRTSGDHFAVPSKRWSSSAITQQGSRRRWIPHSIISKYPEALAGKEMTEAIRVHYPSHFHFSFSKARRLGPSVPINFFLSVTINIRARALELSGPFLVALGLYILLQKEEAKNVGFNGLQGSSCRYWINGPITHSSIPFTILFFFTFSVRPWWDYTHMYVCIECVCVLFPLKVRVYVLLSACVRVHARISHDRFGSVYDPSASIVQLRWLNFLCPVLVASTMCTGKEKRGTLNLETVSSFQVYADIRPMISIITHDLCVKISSNGAYL